MTTTIQSDNISFVSTTPQKPIWDHTSPNGATYVHHLLNTNGPEHYIDYKALRHELEHAENSSYISNTSDTHVPHKYSQPIPPPPPPPIPPRTRHFYGERARSPLADRPDLQDFGADGLGRVLSTISRTSTTKQQLQAAKSPPPEIYQQANTLRSPIPRILPVTNTQQQQTPLLPNLNSLATNDPRLRVPKMPEDPFTNTRFQSTKHVQSETGDKNEQPSTQHSRGNAPAQITSYPTGPLPIPHQSSTSTSMQAISNSPESTPLNTSTPLSLSISKDETLSLSSPSRHHHHQSSRVRSSHVKSLNDLSTFLVSKGHPPLPDEILYTPIPQGLQVSLDYAVSQVLAEYNRRGDVIQHLVRDMQDLQFQQERSATTTNRKDNPKPVSQSPALHNKETNFHVKYEQMLAAKDRSDAESALLRQELTSQLDQEVKRTRHTQSTVQEQSSQPKHGNLDRVTAELIDVYESKLSGMQNELDRLRKSIRQPQNDEDEELDHCRLKTPPIEIDSQQFLRMKHALEQQVLLLQKRVEKQVQATRRVEEERDLLQLQLLNVNKPGTVVNSSTTHPSKDRTKKPPTTVGSTRDLIRRDKLNYKLRLYLVDEMPAESVRDLVKDMCIHLNIDDPLKLGPGLQACAKVLHLVPKMQTYIRDIDVLVWQKSLKATTTSTETRTKTTTTTEKPGLAMHKTKDTLKVLKVWGSEVSVLEHTRQWLEKLIHLLGIHDANKHGGLATQTTDTDAEMQIVQEIRRLLALEKNTYRVSRMQEKRSRSENGIPDSGNVDNQAYTRIVSHFCNLFGVVTLSACVPKLNALFTYVTEIDSAVERIRHVLSVPDTVPACTVLHMAADTLVSSSTDFLHAGGFGSEHKPTVHPISQNKLDQQPSSSPTRSPTKHASTTSQPMNPVNLNKPVQQPSNSPTGLLSKYASTTTSPTVKPGTGSSSAGNASLGTSRSNGGGNIDVWGDELDIDAMLELSDLSGMVDMSSMGSFSAHMSASSDSLNKRRLEQVRMLTESEIRDNIEQLTEKIAGMRDGSGLDEKYFMAD